MSVPNSHNLPGPGEYETEETMTGPHISFTKEKKVIKLYKTRDPGPGSYNPPVSVGVIAGYSNYEANPRETLLSPKQARAVAQE